MCKVPILHNIVRNIKTLLQGRQLLGEIKISTPLQLTMYSIRSPYISACMCTCACVCVQCDLIVSLLCVAVVVVAQMNNRDTGKIVTL